MKFLHPEHDEARELSLEDVFICPGYFDGRSRTEVDLTPDDFAGGAHPLVSANMNAVTGKRMAETMARYGGLGVLPQDMAADTVARIVQHVRQANPRFDTPLAVAPEATLRDVAGIILKRAHDMVVVVDDDARPVGIVTSADLRDRDQYTPVHRLMRRQMVTLRAEVDHRDAFETMEAERVKAAPVVDGAGCLVGLLTKSDAVRLELLEPALNADGRLMVAAAVGISGSAAADAHDLVANGVGAIVIDTAHGHQRRMIEAIRAVRAAIGDAVPLVAGNVCTVAGTEALIEAGADVVKVNVGPGAMCTTRMQTGAGRPSFSSVLHCARAARARGKHVWADGGVRHPRDVALYLAAGASRVMVGTMLAGTYESPGDIKEDPEGFLYKENYGMASARAVADRSEGEASFDRAKKAFFREGISSSRIYLREGLESVGAILTDIISGLSSSATYVGALDLASFRERVVVGTQTPGGFAEGRPHGRVRR
ncbi:MAG: GuaB1 family IMP dehydrogenase-related protein [Myxococcota bacterium]